MEPAQPDNPIDQASDSPSERLSPEELANFRLDHAKLPLTPKLIYSTESSDSAILLFEGNLKLEQDNKQLEQPGQVRFVWVPSPRVEFQIKVPGITNIQRGQAEVSIPIGMQTRANIHTRKFLLPEADESHSILKGSLTKPEYGGSGSI
jgi:hypothetical protein